MTTPAIDSTARKPLGPLRLVGQSGITTPSLSRLAESEMPEHRDYEKRVESTEAERIAIAAAKLAVNDALNETFALFGIERGNFRSVEEFRDDVKFLRSLRKRDGVWHDLNFVRTVRTGSASAGRRFGTALVVIAAGAFAVGVGSALKDWLVFIVSGRHP